MVISKGPAVSVLNASSECTKYLFHLNQDAALYFIIVKAQLVIWVCRVVALHSGVVRLQFHSIPACLHSMRSDCIKTCLSEKKNSKPIILHLELLQRDIFSP